MLTLIAWRNIWRSPTRSLVVIVAVALGLWAGLFLSAFSIGLSEQRARDQLETMVSHVQVHHPDFKGERDINYVIPDGPALLAEVQALPDVVGATGRSLAFGMIASARKTGGVMINGVMPETEAVVTKLDQKLVEGSYFDGVSRNPILISQRTAEAHKLGLRKKVVLTLKDAEGEMVSKAFRVAGIYKSFNSQYDDANVFVLGEDLQDMLGLPGNLHEIALLGPNKEEAGIIKAEVSALAPESLVEDWREISPELRLLADTMDQMMYIFIGIIVLALAFGIINTMLMAVLERTHELGMLMSVGMNKFRIFAMIILETLFMAMIGVPFGLVSAWGMVSWMGQPGKGIDMSAFSQGLEEFGMSSVVYPELNPHYYWQVMLIVAVAAVLSAIYPAIKALKLNPVEAVRAH